MKETTADKILLALKMQGEVSLATLASELGITKEGVRLHLLKLAEKELVKTDSKSEGVGRPVAYYSLTEKGSSKFPDSHSQITVDLLRSVKNLLGENALNLLISDRETKVYQRYEKELSKMPTIEKRLAKLSEMRSEEGYMAEWKKENGAYFLIENHCPIYSAASECQWFCRSELKNIKQLIGDNYEVEREQHIVSGAQRCSYKIKKIVE